MDPEAEDFLGELRLGKKLATIGQVSARGLIVVLGLSFLVSSRTLELVGPVAAVATLLTVFVSGLTLLNLLELLGGSSERGGTYNLMAIVYFLHLIFIWALFAYTPFSKLAHIVYRTVAMGYQEYSGRK